MSFLVLSLPRSRSAWMSHYLGYNGQFLVGHDIAIECETIQQFLDSYLHGMTGTCETGAVVAWRLLLAKLPGVRFLVVRRKLEEVQASFARLQVELVPGELEARAEMLDLIGQNSRVKVVEFHSLGNPEVGQEVFEYCLDIPWDRRWWEHLSRLNIQVDIHARLQQLHRNAAKLAFLQEEIVRETRVLGSTDGLH